MGTEELRFGWGWIVAAIVVLCVMLSPLVFWKKRSLYASMFCLVFILVLTFCWVRDQERRETFFLRLSFGNVIFRQLIFTCDSGDGGIALAMGQLQDQRSPSARNDPTDRRPYFSWQWREAKANPGFPVYPKPAEASGNDTVVIKGGLGFVVRRPPDRMGGKISSKGFGILFPNWTAILMASILPSYWWFIGRHRALRKERRKANLCEKCGYSLNGLPEPVRCPECGTAKPLPKSKTAATEPAPSAPATSAPATTPPANP